MFAEVKVLEQQIIINVHHMHTVVFRVYKKNYMYEQHIYGYTFVPMVNRFVS